ncbi:hypothetical protein B0H14DRAFT_2348184 [Mycena olivaceomarginata]|nr:hypothetical protein B0H14DRAFT_2348184 [Mycena olivaceomarginata]
MIVWGKDGIRPLHTQISLTYFRFDTIIAWYSPLNFSLPQADVFRGHQSGTGAWFLEHKVFQESKSMSGKILWCPGMPDAGKTVLASVVVHHLRTNPPTDNIGVAAIYLNHKESAEHSPSKLLAGLWRQLIFRKSISPEIQKLYEDHCEPRTRLSAAEDLAVLRSRLVSEYSKVFVIVDALDEYLEPDLLLVYLSHLGSTVNLMLTSRPNIVIDHHISNFTPLGIRMTFADTWRGRSKALFEAIEERIVQRSDEISPRFLLAKLHIDSLMIKSTVKSVREAITTMPNDLEHTYDEIVQGINRQAEDDRKVAWLTLSWITNAKRPLRPSELREALAVEPGANVLDPENLLDMSTVISVCAGLVVINVKDDTIRLIHYTIQNYLERIQS